MDPRAIDLSFVPSRRPGLVTVTAGAEALIIDDPAGPPHLLSPTAALVWSFVDGVGSLADFASDLCEVLGTDRRRIERDLLELARDLDHRGLVSGDGDGPPPAAGGEPAPMARRLGATANPALDARFDRPEARLVVVRDGPVELEVRTDDPGLADEVVTDLIARHIDVDPPRPASDRDALSPHSPLYSVLVGRPRGPVTGLQLLYRSGRPLRRCRDRIDMVQIIGADVSGVLRREARAESLLDVVGLTRDGRLVAADPVFSSIIDNLEPSLRRAGVERLDASLVRLLPAERGLQITGLVLRPAPDRGGPQTPAAVALGASDLARGIDGRLGPASLAQLCEVAAAVPLVRVPGRDGLRAAIRDLLA